MKSPPIESNVTVPSHESVMLKNSLRSGLFTTICWSAVLAGVAIAVSVQLVLMMLGVDTGNDDRWITHFKFSVECNSRWNSGYPIWREHC